MITSIQVKDDYVVSGSLDGTVVIWDMWRQRAAHTLTLNNSVFSLHIVGRLLVTECGAAIYIYELATGKMVEELKEKEFVLFSEESRSLVYYQQKPQQFTLYDLDSSYLITTSSNKSICSS
jgi:WD40 repeat protein